MKIKHLKSIFSIAFAICFLTSCQSNEWDSTTVEPKNVVLNFIEKLQSGDLEDAKEMACFQETQYRLHDNLSADTLMNVTSFIQNEDIKDVVSSDESFSIETKDDSQRIVLSVKTTRELFEEETTRVESIKKMQEALSDFGADQNKIRKPDKKYYAKGSQCLFAFPENQ